jgi:hypothetical protein
LFFFTYSKRYGIIILIYHERARRLTQSDSVRRCVGMKKDVLKSLIIGIGITLAIALYSPIIVQAADADIVLNPFRIRNSARTIVDWGQAYTLADGREVPASIVYDGTTYLQIDLASDLYGGYTLWNGDSSTLTLMEYYRRDSSKFLAKREKEDFYGNVWTYQVEYAQQTEGEDNRYFLHIEDENRRYKRSYDLNGPRAYEFADDCVYFAQLVSGKYEQGGLIGSAIAVMKLEYASTPDNQDGYEIYRTDLRGGTGGTGYNSGFSFPFLHKGIMYYFETFSARFFANGINYALYAVDYENSGIPFRIVHLGELHGCGIKIEGINNGYIMFRVEIEVEMYDNNSYFYAYEQEYYRVKTDGTEELVRLTIDEYMEALKH